LANSRAAGWRRRAARRAARRGQSQPLSYEETVTLLASVRQRHPTLVASQLPVEHWHKTIGEPTHADAILDRLVHNAYRITLKGESMRKINAKGGGGPKTKSSCQHRAAALRPGGNFAPERVVTYRRNRR